MNEIKENRKPLITVVVLSYNRCNTLINTIEKLYEIEYMNKEIIVVDNASTDNTVKVLEKEYPEIVLIKLDKNHGVTSWNYGYKKAKGEYVLLLDDDAYPEKLSFEKCNEIFNKSKDVACIAFKILDKNGTYGLSGRWQPPNDYKSNFYPVFNGCCVMFNKKKLNYDKLIPLEFFKNLHELPVSCLIHNSGYKIYFDHSILAIHDFKNAGKYDYYNDSLVFKNSLVFSISYLPFPFNIFDLLRNILFYFSRALRWNWFPLYLDIIFKVKKIKVTRIKLKYYYELKKLKLHYTPFYYKLSKQ